MTNQVSHLAQLRMVADLMMIELAKIAIIAKLDNLA